MTATDEPTGSDDHPPFAIVGTGWTSVVVLRAPRPEEQPADDPLADLQRVSGDWGSGRLLSTRVMSVLFTDDGRVLFGAVTPESLYVAATNPAAQLDGE